MRYKIFAIVFVCISCISVTGFAKGEIPHPSVKARVNKSSAYIGEEIKYSIKISFPKAIDFELSGINAGQFKLAGQAEEKDDKEQPLDVNIMHSGNFKGGRFYTFAIYSPGKYILPQVNIKYKLKDENQWTELLSQALQIEIKSLLSAQARDSDIRDIKEFKESHIQILAVFIACALISAGLFVFFFYRKKKNAPKPEIPPHELAYERLKRLKDKDYISKGRIKEFYIEISDIVRHYFEGRFNCQAQEMTTEEFLSNIRDRQDFSIDDRNLVRDFLCACDLVKFAKYGPAGAEIESCFNLAKEIIDKTKQNVF